MATGPTLLFANGALSTLAGGINNVSTTVVVAAGTGALFPDPSAGQYFTGTFTDAATGLLREIVWCTAVSTDTVTIIRAREGTTALSWVAGDLFANQLTAGTMQSLAQSANIPTMLTSNTTFYCDWAAGNDATGNGSFGNPFKSLGGAYTYLVGDPTIGFPGVNGAGFKVTIQQKATGADEYGLLAAVPVLGAGPDPALPGSAAGVYVVLGSGINTSTATAAIAAVGSGVRIFVSGTGSLIVGSPGSYLLQATVGGFISLSGTSGAQITTGSCPIIKMFASLGGIIQIGALAPTNTCYYTDTGNAEEHWSVDTGGQIIVNSDNPLGLTISATPSYTTWAGTNSNGVITYDYTAVNFTGSLGGGVQFVVGGGGGIDSGGNLAGTLPGTPSTAPVAWSNGVGWVI